MASRDDRLAEVLAEVQERRDRGESVDAAALLRAHPELAGELESLLAFEGLFEGVLGGRTEDADLSVLQRIERITGERSRVLVRDLAHEDTPMIRVPVGEAAPDAPGDDRRYVVAGEIARGGVGVIYKARDKDIGREVALKLLRREHVGDAGVLARFVEEAQIGAQLQHPGIVPVYGLGMQEPGRPYFAMKLIKGRTLGEALRERKGEVSADARLLDAFEQVCQTIGYAHARGVIHRDLKPSNVMLGDYGEVLVVDWGFGKVLGREEPAVMRQAVERTLVTTVRSATEGSASLVGSVMGTPGYMPPEQALGQIESLDERADVFALGAMLCELLTGDPPYTGQSHDRLVQAAQARLEDAHGRLDACGRDAELVAICRKALSPVPRDRYASAGVLAEALSGYLADAERRAKRAEVEAVEERARLEAARREAQWQAQRRRRTRLGLSSAAAAVLIVGGAWLWRDADAASRARAARGDVAAALEAASREAAAERFEAALSQARRAQARAAEADEETQARVAAEVARLAQARDDARREAEQVARDQKLLAELSRIRDSGTLAQGAPYESALLTAFAEYGFDREALFDGRLAAHVGVRGEVFAASVAAHIDQWAWATHIRPDLHEVGASGLHALALALDDDAWRSRAREAIFEHCAQILVDLADEADAQGRAPPDWSLLVMGLHLCSCDHEARDVLRRARQHHPSDRSLLRHWPSLESGAPMRDLRWEIAALVLEPAGEMLWGNVGGRLSQVGREARALQVLEEGVLRFPESTSIQHNAAVSALRAGNAVQLRRALAYFEERARGDGAEAQRAAGAVPRCRQRLAQEATIEGLRRRLAADPESRELHRELAIECAKQPRFADEAVKRLDALVLEFPEDAELHRWLSWALAEAGESARQVDEMRAAVRLDPTNATYQRLLGWAYRVAGGDLDGAIAAFREVLRLDPGRGEDRVSLAETLWLAGAYVDGEQEARLALEQLEGNWQWKPRLTLARCLLAEQRDEEALEHLRALVGTGLEGEAQYHLGNHLLGAGRLADARAALARAVELGVYVRDARRLLRQIAGESAVLRRLPAALSGHPEGGGLRDLLTMASMLSSRRRCTEGAQIVARVLEMQPASRLPAEDRLTLCFLALGCNLEVRFAPTTQPPARSGDRVASMRVARTAAGDLLRVLRNLYMENPPVYRRTAQLVPFIARQVYGAEALSTLPPEEAASWRAFWRDWAALLERIKEVS